MYTAVGALLEGQPAESITIPHVADLAGVTPSTVYRRWGSMDVLLEEVAIEVLTAEEPVPDTGAVTSDLAAWATRIAADLATPRRHKYLRAMIWARSEVVDECPRWEIRRRQADAIVAAAKGRGERSPTADQILVHVIAPLYHHAAFGMRVDDAFAARLVADVISMSDSPV